MTTGHLSEVFVSFQGEGLHAGRRHLFIRLAGCNLRCRYCDTPDSLERVRRFTIREPGGGTKSFDNPIDSRTLLECLTSLLQNDGPLDGTALTGGEPLLQAEFLFDFLVFAVLPRPILLETSGVLPERLQVVLPHVDVVSMDLKIPSNTGESEFWQCHHRFLELAAGKAYVKILIDRGTAETDLARAGEVIRSAAPQVPVFIQPITDPDGQVDVGGELLDRSFSIVRRYVQDVRIMPQTHKLLGIS